MKTIHVIAGVLALLAGWTALCARKGAPVHRVSGRIFVIAMLVMTLSAIAMASLMRPNRVNQVAGTLTFYLVCTSLLTVRPTYASSRAALSGLMLLSLLNGVYALSLAMEGLQHPRGVVDRVPAAMVLIFATVSLFAAAMDLRVLRFGALIPVGRLTRHLWRMTFALWIATASFFMGQAKFFPAVVRQSGVLMVPVLLVTLLLVFWVLRVRLRAGRSAAVTQ